MLAKRFNLKKPVRNNFPVGRVAVSIASFFLCGLLPLVVNAQLDSLSNQRKVTDCEATLAIATAEFNAGRFFSLPSILQDCLDRGFTKEQQVRAYILLCQVYLINDNPDEAEASYIKLLQADPEYIATPAIDPIDVVYLSQKFTTRPVFTPNFKAGLSSSFVSIIHAQATTQDSTNASNTLKLGWTIGGGIDWNMSDRLALSIDALVSSKSLQKTRSNIFDGDISNHTANLTWIDLPLFLKYQDYIGRWRPFAYAGYGFHFTLSSQAQLTYVNVEGKKDVENEGTAPTEGSEINFTKKQNVFNRSLVFGGGMKYKIGKNYLFADLRLNLGLSNVTRVPQIGFADEELTRYNFINDLYRVNSIQLLVGYIIPYYNPRMKGGWEPKGLLRKILYGNQTTTK